MKLIVIDNGINEVHSHHYSINLAIKEACNKNGMDSVFYLQKNIDPQYQFIMNAKPIFDLMMYMTFNFGDLNIDETLDTTFFHNEFFFNNLQKIYKKSILPNDIILFPSTTQNHLIAIGEWLSQFEVKDMPNVLICLGFPGAASVKTIASLYRMGLRRLPNHPKIKFADSSYKSLRIYEEIFADIRPTPVHYIPTFLPFDPPKDQQEKDEKARLKIGYFGHGRLNKGAHMLYPIVNELNKLDMNLEFFIQFHTPFDDGYLALYDVHKTLLKQEPHTMVVETPLSREEYYKYLNECDIILMPYNAISYQNNHSGVLTESMSLGKVIVIPNHTGLSEDANATDYGAVKDIIAAICDAVKYYKSLHKKSMQAQEKFIAEHSAENCIKKIIELFQS